MEFMLGIASVILGALTAPPALSQASTIRQVDFKNFTYPWDEPGGVPGSWQWLETSPKESFRLVRGIHRFIDPNDPEYERERAPGVRMTSVTYGDLDGDRLEEAAVTVNYGTGGSANWNYLYVYKLERGKPKLLGRLEGGSRADGGLIEVRIQNGALVLDFADTERRVADCCSEGYVRVRYRWLQEQFAESGPRSRGDLKLEIHK